MIKRRITVIFSLFLVIILAMGPLTQNTAPVYAESGNFVKSVTYKVNGTEVQPSADGSYSVEVGKNYEVILEFAESEGNQFPNEQFVYNLPSGIKSVATEGDLSINFSVMENGQQVKKTLSGNHYKIASDGTITVTWNTKSDVYQTFKDCGNVSFNLQFSASFDGTSKELTFSDSVKTKITVDDTADLTVTKSGKYNAATNKVEYTATVKGNRGTSHNVVVTDELKGTALSLDQDSIKIKKTPDTAADPTQTSVSEDGFTYKIATVNAGDVYTFTYTASVDVSKITGSGTAAQTENDISVTSDENPTPVTDKTSLNNGIHYTNLSKSVVKDSEDDDKVVLKWTIKYGDKNNAASLGGFTLTDILNHKSDRHNYDTTGHNGISVQENDGDPYTVSWADVGVTTGNEDSWKWTIPEDAAGNTEYTITYYTVYNKKGLIRSDNAKNTVSDGHGHIADKAIQVGRDDLSIVKELTGLNFNDKTASWKITIKVPASGLESAYLVDTYPNTKINGTDHYDTLSGDPVTVSGLLDGESYSFKELSLDHFRMDFESNYSEGGKKYALKPSSSTRTITVTFKTKMDQEWIEASQDPVNSSIRKHLNKAEFHANDQTVDSQAEYYTNPSAVEKTATNNGNPCGYFDSEGNYSTTSSSDNDLPVWKFKVAVTGVNGDIDITDKFDTDLFEIVTETANTGGLADNLRVYSAFTNAGNDVNGKISRATVNGSQLHISSDRLPKYKNNPELYYSGYYIYYYIRVKDQDALQKLRDICVEQGTNLKTTLTNEVTYDGKTDTADFYYTYQGVKKEIVKNGYVDPDDGYTYADFKIVLNPNGEDLDADSDTLDATDTWSDTLAVKPDSFTFTDASGKDISDKVSYEINGRTATFKIPDATPVTITYSARVLGKGQVNYSNTATMKGYISTKSSTVTIKSSGAGSGSVFTIYLLKYADGNLNEPLKGATFSLYKQDESGNKVPVKDNNGNTVTVTTDENGKATLFGSQEDDGWTLYEGTQYYLREETAPSGYQKLSDDYAFKVSDTEQDWDNHLYINGDTITISNEKSDETPDNPGDVTESLSFTKKWVDENADSRPDTATFISWLHLYKTVDGTTTEVTGYTPTVTVDQSDSSTWTVSYSGLPDIDGTYSVKEVIPEDSGYTADYGADGSTSVTSGGTLTNTQEATEVPDEDSSTETRGDNGETVADTTDTTTTRGQTKTVVNNKVTRNNTIEKVAVPRTGDSSDIGVFLGTALAALGCAILISRKRKTE